VSQDTEDCIDCVDHWHCDPRMAAHLCDRPRRSLPCPTCGAAPTIDLARPENLDAAGIRAHEIITTYLRDHGRTHTGGCKAFHSPIEWRVRGEAYGQRSHLVVVYDGGDLRPVFSMDAAYDLDCAHYRKAGTSREPYGLYEGIQMKLREAGLYFEECTNWYCAVYSVESQ